MNFVIGTSVLTRVEIVPYGALAHSLKFGMSNPIPFFRKAGLEIGFHFLNPNGLANPRRPRKYQETWRAVPGVGLSQLLGVLCLQGHERSIKQHERANQ